MKLFEPGLQPGHFCSFRIAKKALGYEARNNFLVLVTDLDTHTAGGVRGSVTLVAVGKTSLRVEKSNPLVKAFHCIGKTRYRCAAIGLARLSG